MEAELEDEKYNPTQEELDLLERKLREINENKFKSLEVQEPVEVTTQEETIEITQDVDNPSEVLETEEPESIKEDKTVDGSKINRLSYTSRNASNVTVQRI